MNLRTLSVVSLVSLAAALPASAQFVAGITGLDNTGAGVSPVNPDLNYVLTDYPSGSGTTALVINNHAGWLANNSTSKWIGPADYTTNSPNGNYYYDLTFDIDDSLVDPDSVFITGRWATDNYGFDIKINESSSQNVRIEAGTAPFNSWGTFSLGGAGLFKDGENTLTFIVHNLSGVSNNPTGLRVEFLTAIPEPSTYALALGALVLGVVGYRRWRMPRSAVL